MAWSNIFSRMWRSLGLGVNVRYGYLPMLRGGDADLASGDPASLPAVYGAISILSDALTGLEWSVVASLPGGNGVVPKPDHPASRAIARWPISDRWAWCWNALYAGNGIAHVVHDAGPMRLDTYPAERVTMLLFEDESLRYNLVSVAGGTVAEVRSEECATLRYRPTGRDNRVGISPLITCSPALDLLLTQRHSTRAILHNSARPSGVLMTDRKIDPQRAEAMKERWDRARNGARGDTAVLEEGLKYETLELNDLQELAAVESANLGVQEVARLFNVPPSILAGDTANRATAVEDRRRILAFAVSPLCRLAEDALGTALLTEAERERGLRVFCDDTVTLLGQGNELGDTVSKLLNAGCLTPNECRALLAFPAVPDGDLLRAPSNTYALPAWADWEPSSGNGAPAAASAASLRLAELRTRLLQ